MKKLFLLLALFSCVISVNASHISGGGIEYTCIGPRQWKIRLTIYRDCGNTNLCLSSNCSQPMVAKPSTTLNQVGCTAVPNTVNFLVAFVSVKDVNKLEVDLRGPAAKNGCDNLGQSTPGPNHPSVEAYTFEGTLNLNLPTLNAANTCEYWDVYWEQCCRSFGITNLAIPGQQSLKLVATINVFNRSGAVCQNNSPVVNNDHSSMLCSGQKEDFNLAAIDPDGDSLSYEIGPSSQINGISAVYQQPYGPTYPFPLDTTRAPHLPSMQPNGPFVVIDSVSGNISFIPINNTSQFIFGSLVVYIKQWTKNTQGLPLLAGITRKDYLIYVRNCLITNKPIVLNSNPANPDGSFKTSYTVAAGDSLTINLMALDSDFYPNIPRYDSTKIIFVYESDTNATFTSLNPGAREDHGVFRYRPLTTQANTTQSFTLVAVDNNIPMSIVSKQFVVQVLYGAYTLNVNKKADSCGNHKVYYTNRTNVQHLQWKISTVAGDYSLSPSSSTVYNNDSLIPLSFNTPGKYLMQMTLTRIYPAGTSVILYDTIIVEKPTFKKPNLDSVVCKGSSLLLTLPEGNYSWRLLGQSTPFATNDSVTISPLTTAHYIYSGNPADSLYPGCILTDTASIVVKPAPQTNMPDSMIRCGTSLTLNATNTTTGQTTAYAWSHTTATTATVPVNQPGVYTATLVQNNGCSIQDSVTVYDGLIIPLTVSPDTSVCLVSTVTLSANGGTSYTWFEKIDANPVVINLANSFNVTINQAGIRTFIVMAQNPGNLYCPAKDTVIITGNAPAILVRPATQYVCSDEPFVSIASFNSTQPGTGTWSYPEQPSFLMVDSLNKASVNTTVIPIPPRFSPSSHWIRYNFITNAQCLSKDSVLVKVHAKPNTNAGSDRSFCANTPQMVLSTTQGALPSGGVFYNKIGQNITHFNPANADTFPSTNELSYSMRYQYDGWFICERTDSFAYTVYAVPPVNGGSDKSFCVNSPQLELNTIQGALPPGGIYHNGTGQEITHFNPANANVFPLTNQLSYTKMYEFEDSLICTRTDGFVYTVYPLPAVDAGSDKLFCEDQPPVLLNTQNATPFGGQFYDSTGLITSFDPALAKKIPQTNIMAYVYGENHPGITCYNADTFTYAVSPVAKLQSLAGNFFPVENTVHMYTITSNPFHTITWLVEGGIIQSSSQDSATVLWTDTGDASITVTAQNNYCFADSVTMRVIIQPSVGLDKNDLQNKLLIYPNPVSQQLFIEYGAPASDLSIELFNTTMQRILLADPLNQNGKMRSVIDVHDLATGMYFVRVTVNGSAVMTKILVTR